VIGNHLNRAKKNGRTLAAQFLQDDNAQGFSKKKYEDINSSKRRMGTKKKAIKM